MAIKSPPQTYPRSIESIFTSYLRNEFVVNRKYQRKLVWTLVEKQKFIETLIKGYPIPLIILVKRQGRDHLEILDGLQRLNAITSYIENEYSIDDGFFDCLTFTGIKDLLDGGEVEQNKPVLSRDACRKIAQYQLPIMTCEFDDEKEIDEAFRLINSNGQILSPQELRHAGSTSEFAQVVSTTAQAIRRDESPSEIIPLSQAKLISIGSLNLTYGVSADEIFWITNFICDRKALRRSYDEELIADMLAYMLLDGEVTSSKKVKDSLYDSQSARYKSIEEKIVVRGKKKIEDDFLMVHDEIRKIISVADTSFRAMIGAPSNNPVPRYYQSVFLAIWEIVNGEGRQITDYSAVANALSTVHKSVDVGGGGGEWTAEKRKGCARQVKGYIHQHTAEANTQDAMQSNTAMYVERLILQSKFESNLFDFKQGLHSLHGPCEFADGTVQKCIKTLCAIVNGGPGTTGHIIIGVCDDDEDAEQVENLYGITVEKFGGKRISGVDHEIQKYDKPDDYFRKLQQAIKNCPVSEWVKTEVTVVPVDRFGRTVVVLRLSAGQGPEHYGDKYYQREALSLNTVDPGQPLSALFARFSSGRD